MTQNTLSTLITLFAAVLIIVSNHIDAKCNVCSGSGIACINETSFNICSGGQPRTEDVFTCSSNKFCSDTSLKCVDAASGGRPACEPKKGCGICDGNKIFACTSRTTFAQCDGEKLTNNLRYCSDGLVCDSQSGEICKNPCNRPDILECDIDAAL